MKKGFLFSTDAFIALIILLSVIFGVFVLLSQSESDISRKNDLSEMGYDLLEIMKSHKIFSMYLSENDNRIISHFLRDHLPEHICAEVILFDKFMMEISKEKKPGCELSQFEEPVKTNLIFVSEKKIYNTEMILWYK